MTTGEAAPNTFMRVTVFLTLFLLLAAAPVPASFDQVKAEPIPERRARAAVDFAATAGKKAGAAFSNGDMKEVAEALNTMKESMELPRDSLVASKRRRDAILSFTSMPSSVPANC